MGGLTALFGYDKLLFTNGKNVVLFMIIKSKNTFLTQ